MDEHDKNSRISVITTMWNLVARAHQDSDHEAIVARWQLLERYQGAVHRYLLAALRDSDAADELFQEFALKMARGDFRRAAPERGRFRQFLKASLINLIRDYRKRAHRGGLSLEDVKWQPADDIVSESEEDQRWLVSWREHLLERVWQALREVETKTGRPHYTALRFRTEHLEASSADIARHLNATLCPERPWTDVAARKLLQRARAEFADLLVEEVKVSMECHTPEELEAELIELELHTYCRARDIRKRW
jgi:RNA polymerase sigma-70 factor (ECF subfamily)